MKVKNEEHQSKRWKWESEKLENKKWERERWKMKNESGNVNVKKWKVKHESEKVNSKRWKWKNETNWKLKLKKKTRNVIMWREHERITRGRISCFKAQSAKRSEHEKITVVKKWKWKHYRERVLKLEK